MATCIHWVLDGRIVPAPPEAEGASPIQERDLLQRFGFVKLVESEEGTAIRWSMFSRNWASLFFAAEWLQGAFGPYQLQYYSVGWFNERHDQPWMAADRLHHLLHKSDVHLSQTVSSSRLCSGLMDLPCEGSRKGRLNPRRRSTFMA